MAHREVRDAVHRQVKPASRQTSDRRDWQCVACGGARHGLSACAVYRNCDVEARWNIVRTSGLCFRCLGLHFARDCSSVNCLSCGGPHHTSPHSTGEQRPPPGTSGADRQPPSQRSDRRYQPSPAYRERSSRPASFQPPLSVGQQSHRPGWSTAVSCQTTCLRCSRCFAASCISASCAATCCLAASSR